MSRVLHGSISSRMPADLSLSAANCRLRTNVSRVLGRIASRRCDAGETIDLRALQGGCILDRLADAVLKFADAIGQAGDAALALGPIAGGQVMQHLREPIRRGSSASVLLGVGIGEQVFDAVEACVLRRLETVEKVDLVEQHRQIGVEFRHGALCARVVGPNTRPIWEGSMSTYTNLRPSVSTAIEPGWRFTHRLPIPRTKSDASIVSKSRPRAVASGVRLDRLLNRWRVN